MSGTRKWTKCDSAKALREGWEIFNDTEIQRDDETGIFASDDDAVAFVMNSNTSHAKKARMLAGL